MGVFWENSFAAFLVLTIVLGGGAAWMTGQSLARGWRPWQQPVAYMIPLALAVRFFHWSLAGGTLLSARYLLTDFTILTLATVLSWRMTRTTQMVTQYPWLYRRAGQFGWISR